MISAVSAQAGTIIVPSIQRGHITDDGGSIGNTNYLTGARELHAGPGGGGFTVETRSYFIFDLSAIPDEATSAVFRVYSTPTGYTSPDAFETLALNPIDKHPLTAFGGTSPGTAAFADLGDDSIAPHAPYGSRDIQSTEVDTFIEIQLSGQALWDLNQVINFSPLGWFGFGGKLTSLGLSVPGDRESVFGNSGGPGGAGDGDTVLILSGPKIPEPASLAILTFGAVAMLRRSRRSA